MIAWHIFHKDAIRLRPQIAIFLALLAINGWVNPRYAPYGLPQPLLFLPLLLPVACSVLVIALVHEEGLVGDRKYWLSRPFPRRRLIGAKVLFVLVFISLPLFMYQAAIILAAGLPLSGNWVNLACMQLFFTAIDILPVAALAAVTRNAVQTVLTALTAVTAIVVISSLEWWGSVNAAQGMSWIDITLTAAILGVVALAVLILQYRHRATTLSRAILAGGTIAVVFATLPYSFKWAIQMRLSAQPVDASAIRISRDSEGGPLSVIGDWAGNPDFVDIEIPIRIDNLPPGDSVTAVAIRPVIEAASAEAWKPGWIRGEIREKPGANRFQSILIDRKFYQRVKNASVHIYGLIDLAVLRTIQTLPRPLLNRVTVPGIGVCASYPNTSGARPPALLSCNSTLPSARLVAVVNGVRDNTSIPDLAPYPTSVGYSPLTPLTWNLLVNGQPSPMNGRTAEVHLEVQKPIAYIQRPFDFQNIRLSGYAVEPPSLR